MDTEEVVEYVGCPSVKTPFDELPAPIKEWALTDACPVSNPQSRTWNRVEANPTWFSGYRESGLIPLGQVLKEPDVTGSRVTQIRTLEAPRIAFDEVTQMQYYVGDDAGKTGDMFWVQVKAK